MTGLLLVLAIELVLKLAKEEFAPLLPNVDPKLLPPPPTQRTPPPLS